MVGPPPWFALPQSTHLPYCDLPAETCCLARPVPLHFIGIWRLLMAMCSGREATATPPETQVLSRIGGDNLVHSPEQRQFLWKAENESLVLLARNSQEVNERRFESAWRVMPESQGLEPARVFRANAVPTQGWYLSNKKYVIVSGAACWYFEVCNSKYQQAAPVARHKTILGTIADALQIVTWGVVNVCSVTVRVQIHMDIGTLSQTLEAVMC
jgi:hypothetical protein